MMNKRVLIFSFILFFLLSACFAYLNARLVPQGLNLFLLAGVCGFVFVVPVVYWVGDRDGHTLVDEILQRTGFFSMGILSLLLTLTVLRDLLLTLFWALSRYEAYDVALLQGPKGIVLLSVFFMSLGWFLAAKGPAVKRVEIKVPGLPDGLEGFKIAQLSDLHVGLMIDLNYVKKTVQLTRSLSADVVVLTGDIVDESLQKIKNTAAELANLAPKGKIFYVPGNHEYYWNGPEWIQYFKELGFRVLLNKSEIVHHQGEKILIGGVVDWAAESFTQQKPDAELASRGEAAYKILLAHQPKIAESALKAGFDLQLSGHTHGGQFFPWTLLVQRVHVFFLGLHQLGKMWIYVNPGTGSWGPPLRLGTRTEVTLLTLKKTTKTI